MKRKCRAFITQQKCCDPLATQQYDIEYTARFHVYFIPV